MQGSLLGFFKLTTFLNITKSGMDHNQNRHFIRFSGKALTCFHRFTQTFSVCVCIKYKTHYNKINLTERKKGKIVLNVR